MFGMNSIYSSYGRYGGYGVNSLMPNYSRVNDMRLISAASRRLNSVSNSKEVGSTYNQYNRYNRYNWKDSSSPILDTETASFLKEYQNTMSDLLQKSDALRADNPRSRAGELSAKSSNEDILTADIKYRLSEPASYKVNVSQLAAAQKNVSEGVDRYGNDDMTGNLVIATSDRANPISVNVGNITGKNNYEKLQNVAREINRYRTNVTAQVVVNEGKASLELSGSETGKSNAFNVTGTYAQSSGLDKAKEAAQDAEYSVAKDGGKALKYTSESNTVNVGGYKLQANLKKTGEATLETGVDNEKTADAIGDLVGSYNSALKLLNDNASRGRGVLQQMRRMVQPPVSEKSMAQVGVTANKDGTLSFNRDTYLRQADLYPSLAKSIVSGSYSIANGIYDDAKAGMNISSSRLTGINPAGNRYSGASYMQMQNSYLQNPLNYFSTYNSSGMVSLFNNNSVGLLMNINI